MRNKSSDLTALRATAEAVTIVGRHWLKPWPAAVMLLLLFCPLLLSAQKERSNMIGIGHTSLLDTYLSQEKATGTELRYTWQKTSRKPERHWSSAVTQEAFVTKAGTRGNDNSFIGAMYNLRFGWHYNFDPLSPSPVVYAAALQQPTQQQPTQPLPPLNIRVGLLADMSLGGLYNTRNSNNPAQARASLNIDPSAMVTWRFSVKGKPFALRYEAAMPLIGIAFSPNYGQSYYEIFTQGNYDHNVVFISPFSGPQLHHALSLDFRLWRTTFTVGYFGDIRQMEANSLKYHQYTHGVAIGWRY